MSDLRKQIHEHYEKKELLADKVEAILARGRAVAGGENIVAMPVTSRRRWPRALALAAALAIFAGLAAWWQHEVRRPPFAVVPVGLMEFFATKQEVDPAPEGKEALHALLVQRGAPPDFRIPASLLPLENAACQVIDMQGKDVYLACFWRVDGAGRGLSELVHLVVARRDDFRDAPPSTQPQFSEPDGWSFASWSEADIIYTLAAPAPMDILRPFAPGTLSADRMGDFLAVSLNTWSFSAFLGPIREDSAQ